MPKNNSNNKYKANLKFLQSLYNHKPQNKKEVHVQKVNIDKVPKLAVDHVVDLVIKSRFIAEAKCMTESGSSQ